MEDDAGRSEGNAAPGTTCPWLFFVADDAAVVVVLGFKTGPTDVAARSTRSNNLLADEPVGWVMRLAFKTRPEAMPE